MSNIKQQGYVPFCVEAELVTPLAFNSMNRMPVCLDSLLARVMVELDAAGRGDGAGGDIVFAPVWRGDLKGPAPELPLTKVKIGGRDVYAASIGFPVGMVTQRAYTFTQKWSGERCIKPSAGDKGISVTPAPDSGYYRDRLEVFILITAPKIRFYGCGDVEAVESLLQNVTSLGYKRKRGFGRVKKWEVRRTSRDYSVWLRTSELVTPARILPLGALKEEPAAVYYVSNGNVDFPRWMRERQEKVLFPLPAAWQEGLQDGTPDSPEINPRLGFGPKGLAALVQAMQFSYEDEDELLFGKLE
ncbi:hypothetical protein SDD30_15305 [Moorella naiadis]|uniref:hypothetical protein n=1 Tax=Moorella naiadis (nom. illeg.) TaxID=3093670 RepID=UPI003D9C7E18